MKNYTKRCAVLLLASAMLFCIFGCGSEHKESDNEIEPISQIIMEDIDSIGEVTLDDEALINKLIERYDSLTEEQKQQVTNYSVLTSAQEKLEALKTEANVAKEQFEPESEPVEEEKDPWDLTGSWCEDSVENGKPGMAAFLTADKMTVYSVTDKQSIYSPFWIGTYEVQEGKDIFTWVSINDVSNDEDYCRYSGDEKKDFSYENGKISFITVTGEEETQHIMHRTDIDFSRYYRTEEFGMKEKATIGCFDFVIPESFGLFDESYGDKVSVTKMYLSSDAMLLLQRGKDIDGMENMSDSEVTLSVKANADSYKKTYLMKDSELREENFEKIANCDATSLHISGIESGGMKGDGYFATITNKYEGSIISIQCFVSNIAEHDYEKDFNELINNITINKEMNKKIALSKLDKVDDEVAKATFYKPSSLPDNMDKTTYVLPYIGVEDNNTIALHLILNYYESDWVFWDKAIFAIDDERYEMNADPVDIHRDVARSGKVVEHYDNSRLLPEDIGMMRRIVDSEKTIVRFEGDYKFDYTFTDDDKQAFADVLAAYDALKYN